MNKKVLLIILLASVLSLISAIYIYRLYKPMPLAEQENVLEQVINTEDKEQEEGCDEKVKSESEEKSISESDTDKKKQPVKSITNKVSSKQTQIKSKVVSKEAHNISEDDTPAHIEEIGVSYNDQNEKIIVVTRKYKSPNTYKYVYTPQGFNK